MEQTGTPSIAEMGNIGYCRRLLTLEIRVSEGEVETREERKQ
ncbi:MAG TPA: hypothetical protein VK085_11300 [Pseudogracilibacillus sp.]|nr:hypothetical protein [Pseudogracilibacillus sp.]